MSRLFAIVVGLAAIVPLASVAGQDFPSDFGSGEVDLGIGPNLKFKKLDLAGNKSLRVSYVKARNPNGAIVVSMPEGDWGGSGQRRSEEWLPEFLTTKGYTYVSFRFGERPKEPSTAAAADVAGAVAKLRLLANEIGFDPSRLILLGSGSGGQFAAQLATDSTYLQAVGVPSSAICAVVTVDGESPDIPAYPAKANHRFDAGAFLLLTGMISRRPTKQADRLAEILREAGSLVERDTFPTWIWGDRHSYIGLPENRATRHIGTFLDAHCLRSAAASPPGLQE